MSKALKYVMLCTNERPNFFSAELKISCLKSCHAEFYFALKVLDLHSHSLQSSLRGLTSVPYHARIQQHTNRYVIIL